MKRVKSDVLHKALQNGEWIVSWVRGNDIIEKNEKVLNTSFNAMLVVNVEDTDHFIRDDDYTIMEVNGAYVVMSNELLNGTLIFSKAPNKF